jgi:hypothetical protein
MSEDPNDILHSLLSAQERAAERVDKFADRLDIAYKAVTASEEHMARNAELLSKAYEGREMTVKALHAIELRMATHEATSTATTKEVTAITTDVKNVKIDVSKNKGSLDSITGRVIGIAAGISFIVGALGFLIMLVKFGQGGG